MYPLKFNNIYIKKIWGGRNLEKFRDNIPDGLIGESWDVSSSKEKSSIITNGKFKGRSLIDLIKEFKKELVGEAIEDFEFPLLVKVITAEKDLSVQVHPDDAYAYKNGDSLGKAEIWYILDADEDSEIVIGIKDKCTKKEFIESLGTKDVEKCLKKVKVNKGDVYFIQSGLIHSIGKGVSLIEIQENSDITYRVYDYERDRQLHLEDAKNVINFNIQGEKEEGTLSKHDGYNLIKYFEDKHFTLEKIDVNKEYKDKSDIRRFYIYTCVKGSGKIIYDDGYVDIQKSESVLIPASTGKYKIKGNLELLKSYPTLI